VSVSGLGAGRAGCGCVGSDSLGSFGLLFLLLQGGRELGAWELIGFCLWYVHE